MCLALCLLIHPTSYPFKITKNSHGLSGSAWKFSGALWFLLELLSLVPGLLVPSPGVSPELCWVKSTSELICCTCYSGKCCPNRNAGTNWLDWSWWEWRVLWWRWLSVLLTNSSPADARRGDAGGGACVLGEYHSLDEIFAKTTTVTPSPVTGTPGVADVESTDVRCSPGAETPLWA